MARFFQDCDVFHVLARDVFPGLISRASPDRAVRAWVIGGSGEAAYSIAMLLVEQATAADPPRTVSVLATDVDDPLRRVRSVYPAEIALDVGNDRLARFFVRAGGGWEVGPILRRRVLFATHDLLRNPPPSPVDLVWGRGLLARLAPEHRAEVLPRLHEALRPDGVLVVSPGEMSDVPDAAGLFVPAGGRDHGIHRRLGPEAAPPETARTGRRKLRSLSGELRETRRRVEEVASGALSQGDIELIRAVFVASAAPLELDACFCHLADGDGLRLVAQVGLPAAAVGALARVPVAGSIPGEAVRTGKMVRIDQIWERSGPAAAVLAAAKLEALVCQPVVVDGRVIATVAVCVRDASRLGRRAIGWLATVAELVAAGRRRVGAEAALLARVDAERATIEQILQQLPSGVLLADAVTGEIVFANLAAEQTFGPGLPRTAGDLESWRPLRPDGRPYEPRELPLIRALRGEVVNAEEVLLRRPDGQMFLHVNAGPVRDAHGVLRFAIQACVDLTRQKRAEAALRELAATLEAKVEQRTLQVRRTEERFRALVDASAQIVWSADSRGEFVEDSPSWRAFTGQSLEAWLANAWFEMVHPDDRRAARERWEAAVRSDTPVDTEMRLYHAPSRTWRWTHARAVPLRDTDGRVLEWVGMIADLTARKEAERDRERLARQLLVAEQEERQRISRILHDDLQQILYGVLLRLRAIERDVRRGDDPVLGSHLEEVRSWVGRAVDTTRQLTVDLCPPLLTDRGLGEALRWLADQMRTLHGLEVAVQAEPGVAIDDAVGRLLFEIARELLFNVAKHAGVDRADLRLVGRPQAAVLEVSDSGRGYDGKRGFGLTSIGERLRLVGGRLEVRGAPGRGTQVTVTAPLGSECDLGDTKHRGESK